MNADSIINLITETEDTTNLCVIIRAGVEGLMALLVADEKGRWSIPGGHAKPGETNAQAAKREVKEETGLDVDPLPLYWAWHQARDRASTLFYAASDEGEIRPGGGDVTAVQWEYVNRLDSKLIGTDILAIHVAANRFHNPGSLVDDAVGVAESWGYAVGNVSAPPVITPGRYIRLTGPDAQRYAEELHTWITASGRPASIVQHARREITEDALKRASHERLLTGIFEALLLAADAIWHYEDEIAPKLASGRVVLEVSEPFNRARLLQRNVPPDMADCIIQRVPQPSLTTEAQLFSVEYLESLKHACSA